MKKRHISWIEVEYAVNQIVNKFEKFKFDYIFGISRGGLIPAVMLSHQLDIPLIIDYKDLRLRYDGKINILIIDEINDTGKEMTNINTYFQTILPHVKIKTATLHTKTTTKNNCDYTAEILCNNEWLVYPWEKKKNDKMV